MHTPLVEWKFALLPMLFSFWQTFLAEIGVGRAWQRMVQTLRDDWRTTRLLSYGLIVFFVTTAFTSAYYFNHPQPEVFPDSPGYFKVTQQILAHGNFVDALRTPGYPTFVALIFLIAGQSNLAALSIGQAILFIGATVEIYGAAFLLLRRAWIALVIGILMGINITLLSYVKTLASEALGLWLVCSLALAAVLFVQRFRKRYLWLTALCTLMLFMTRPEWIYLPVLLFAYLLFLAWRHGQFRRFLPHILAAAVLLNSVLGLYSYLNGVENGYMGITYNQRGNLLGKVLQYHMQNEAPPQYAKISAIVNAYVAQGGDNPDILVTLYPPLAANHWQLSGEYAQAIVDHHPLEFLVDTIPVFFTSSNIFYLSSRVSAQGPFATPLLWIQRNFAYVANTYITFPFFALLWMMLLFWRRTTRLPVVEGMGIIVLLALYGLTLTSLGGYVAYARLHTPFDPLFLLVIIGTPLASLSFFESLVARRRWRWGTVGIIAGALIMASVVVSIAKSWLAEGWSAAFQPQTWVIEHLIVKHPTLSLAGLAVIGFMIWHAYRSHLAFVRSGQQDEQARGRQPPDAENTDLLEVKT